MASCARIYFRSEMAPCYYEERRLWRDYTECSIAAMHLMIHVCCDTAGAWLGRLVKTCARLLVFAFTRLVLVRLLGFREVVRDFICLNIIFLSRLLFLLRLVCLRYVKQFWALFQVLLARTHGRDFLQKAALRLQRPTRNLCIPNIQKRRDFGTSCDI